MSYFLSKLQILQWMEEKKIESIISVYIQDK